MYLSCKITNYACKTAIFHNSLLKQKRDHIISTVHKFNKKCVEWKVTILLHNNEVFKN